MRYMLEQALICKMCTTCEDNIYYNVKQMIANKSVFDLGWISRDKLSFSQGFSVSDFLYFNDIFTADGWTYLATIQRTVKYCFIRYTDWVSRQTLYVSPGNEWTSVKSEVIYFL